MTVFGLAVGLWRIHRPWRPTFCVEILESALPVDPRATLPPDYEAESKKVSRIVE